MKKFIFNIIFSFATVTGFSQVTFYRDSGFRGESVTLTCYDTNLKSTGWGDCFSSVTVSGGYSITWYEHSGFRGASYTLYSGQHISNLGDFGWNDQISSFQIYYDGVLQNECVWSYPDPPKREKDGDYHGRW